MSQRTQIDLETQRRKVIRQAAGQYQLRDADGHQGRYVCPECPDDRHIPPFKPIGLLPIWRREHEERTGHRVQVYCFVCCDFHTTEAMETPLEIAWLAEGPPEVPLLGPGAVLGAMEVLRRAGYLVRVATAPALPEPEMMLLPYREADTLAAIRRQPGLTIRELAAKWGLSISTMKSHVRMLALGKHVRAELHSYPGERGARFRRLYPTHDKPIGKVRARQKARWPRL